MQKNKSVNHALSNQEIKNKVGYNINIIRYSQLNQCQNIEQCLSNGVCVILYETEPNKGHWTVLLKTIDDYGNQILEMFDPYGMDLEAEKRYIDNGFMKQNNMDHNILAKLLYECSIPSSYNQYHFQKMKDNVATCGRWVIARIKNKNMSLNDFHDKFGNYSDEQISKMF